jgi:putative salt-induced outer membrane protein YdiY
MCIFRIQVKRILTLLATCATVFSGRADSNPGPGTNAVLSVTAGTNLVVSIRQGTNVITTVIPGTNAVVTILQGTNTVVTVLEGAKAMPPVKKSAWASLIAAGFAVTRGNSDTLLATVKAQSQRKDEYNEWLFDIDGAYGVNNSVVSADNLHGLAQYNHLFTEKFYNYVNADALHDDIQALKYRVSLSPGVGYYLIKTKPTLLSVEMGPGLVSEVRGDDEGNDSYMSWRMAEHWEHKITPTTKLWEKVEILPEITRFENYAANMEFGVDTAITKTLSLQVTLDDSYVNEPAAGRVSNDLKLISGIAWKF